jgi:hypothetical protein
MLVEFVLPECLDELDIDSQRDEPSYDRHELQKEPEQRSPGDPEHHQGVEDRDQRLPSGPAGLFEEKIGAKGGQDK